MRILPGHREAPQVNRGPTYYQASLALAMVWLADMWSFSLRIARHPWARVVVLILLTMFQLVLLWLLGQMVELCLALMEVWLELARKHLEITLDTTT